MSFKSPSFRPALALLTLSLSPYRYEFFSRIARKIRGAGGLLVLQKSPAEESHGWKPFKEISLPWLLIKTTGDASPLKHKEDRASNLKKPWSTDWPQWRCLEALARFQPKAVCSYDFSAFCWSALVWKILFRIPLIISTEIGPRSQKKIPFWKRWNQMLFLNQANLVLAHTRDAAQWPKSILCPHGVDSNEYRPGRYRRRNPAPVILFVGVPDLRKGVDLLADALAAIHGKAPFRCRIVGVAETHKKWVRSIFSQRGLKTCLDLIPFVEGRRLVEEYQKADLFVLPSRFDTFGVVAHEAACCGLPLIVSQFAGASEILVRHGVNGFVVNPHVTKEFSARILAVLADRARRQKMARASRKIGVKYDVQKTADLAAKKILSLLTR